MSPDPPARICGGGPSEEAASEDDVKASTSRRHQPPKNAGHCQSMHSGPGSPGFNLGTFLFFYQSSNLDSTWVRTFGRVRTEY